MIFTLSSSTPIADKEQRYNDVLLYQVERHIHFYPLSLYRQVFGRHLGMFS